SINAPKMRRSTLPMVRSRSTLMRAITAAAYPRGAGQAQARAATRPIARRFGAIEALEDVLELICRDPFAGVFDADNRETSIASERAHCHQASLRRVPHGVANQIGQYLG